MSFDETLSRRRFLAVLTGSVASAVAACGSSASENDSANPAATAGGSSDTGTSPVPDASTTGDAGTIAPSPASATTIAGAVHLFGSAPGPAVLVSNVWPLRRGDLTEADLAANRPSLFVAGAEKAAHIEAARGRYDDGSLRGLLIQFTHDLPDATPVAAELRLGEPRTLGSIARTPITQDIVWDMTATPVAVKAMCLPTDPAYLCDTRVAGVPLVPLAKDDADISVLVGPLFDRQFEALKSLDTTSSTALADYEHIRALVAQWCRTADTKYLVEALSRARYYVDYNMPAVGGSWSPTPNLEGIATTGTIASNETKSQRFGTWWIGYYLTGWPSFHSLMNAMAQQGMRIGQDPVRGYLDSATQNPRFNSRLLGAVYYAPLMDATQVMKNPSGAGFAPAAYGTELARVWETLLTNRYVDPGGAGTYRSDAVLVSGTVDNTGLGAPAVGDYPTFQAALAARHMVDYYLMVHANPALPAMIKRQVDMMISNAGPLLAGEAGRIGGTGFTWAGSTYSYPDITETYGYPYWVQSKPGRLSSSPFGGYTLCMWLPSLAFVHKHFGGNGPDGVPYATWYRRAANPRNVSPVGSGPLVWSWKIFGEVYGGTLVASWIMAQPGPPEGPAYFREPTQHTTWPT